MKVVLVDPVSSGTSLAEAFRERGVQPFHVYQPELRHAFDADPAPGGKLLHGSFGDTCAALKQRGTEAVLAGSEAGVTLAEELAAALGLPHNTLELAPARRDKLLMARALEAAGVAAAHTEAVTGEAELAAALRRFGSYPVVVKPATSAGSDGLAICDTADEVRAACRALLGQANLLGLRNDVVLLQEYLDGPQYVLDTVSVGGRHLISELLLLRFDEIAGKPVQRHDILRRELDENDRQVVEYGLRCLDALGVTDGAGHTEIRLTDRGPLLVEVNSRLHGPVLPADPYLSALGHSHATLLADSVLDVPACEAYADRGYAPPRSIGFVFMRTQGSGTVRSMPGLDRIRRLPTFHSFAKLPELGTEVRDPLLTTGNAGLAYFVGPDADAILADIEQLHVLEDNGLLYEMSEPLRDRDGGRP
jgi:hypothetical protein